MTKKIYVMGTRYWCKNIKEQIQARVSARVEVIEWSSLRSLSRIFMAGECTLLTLGLGARITPKRLMVWVFLIAFWLRHRGQNKLIFYWIGSDVTTLQDNVIAGVYLNVCKWLGVRHICGAPWFVEELRASGISAEPVLFPYDTGPAYSALKPCLPHDPMRICAYLTVEGWSTLNGERTLNVARLTPSIEWVVMGMSDKDVPKGLAIPANMTFVGWVEDPVSLQAGTHALFRLVEHDALSAVVRDALALGNIVFYTLPVEGVVNISGKSDVDIADILGDFSRCKSRSKNTHPRSCEKFIVPYEEQVERLVIVLGEGR